MTYNKTISYFTTLQFCIYTITLLLILLKLLLVFIFVVFQILNIGNRQLQNTFHQRRILVQAVLIAEIHILEHDHEARQHLGFDSHAHGVGVAFLDFRSEQFLEQSLPERADAALNHACVGLSEHVAEDREQAGVKLVAAVDLEALLGVLFEDGQGREDLREEVGEVVDPGGGLAVDDDRVDEAERAGVDLVDHEVLLEAEDAVEVGQEVRRARDARFDHYVGTEQVDLAVDEVPFVARVVVGVQEVAEEVQIALFQGFARHQQTHFQGFYLQRKSVEFFNVCVYYVFDYAKYFV